MHFTPARPIYSTSTPFTRDRDVLSFFDRPTSPALPLILFNFVAWLDRGRLFLFVFYSSTDTQLSISVPHVFVPCRESFPLQHPVYAHKMLSVFRPATAPLTHKMPFFGGRSYCRSLWKCPPQDRNFPLYFALSNCSWDWFVDYFHTICLLCLHVAGSYHPFLPTADWQGAVEQGFTTCKS